MVIEKKSSCLMTLCGNRLAQSRQAGRIRLTTFTCWHSVTHLRPPLPCQPSMEASRYASCKLHCRSILSRSKDLLPTHLCRIGSRFGCRSLSRAQLRQLKPTVTHNRESFGCAGLCRTIMDSCRFRRVSCHGHKRRHRSCSHSFPDIGIADGGSVRAR